MANKLSFPMQQIMDRALITPVSEYGNASQLKGLAKRGLMTKDRGWWVLTAAGIAEMNGNTNVIALEYARFYFRHSGFQIRHNVLMVEQKYNDDNEYILRHEWYGRSHAEEVNAIADFQKRAIDLARAEWRAGIAQAEIGLVG